MLYLFGGLIEDEDKDLTLKVGKSKNQMGFLKGFPLDEFMDQSCKWI